MMGQTANPAGFRLPAACVDLAAHLGGQFGFSSHLLLPCFPLALGLAASPCRLDTGIWPEPISAALDLALGVDNEKGFRLAVDHVLAPALSVLAKNTIAGMRSSNAEQHKHEMLVIGNRVPEQATAGNGLISEPARPRAVVVANLRPGQLRQVTDQHPNNLTLAVYDNAHFVQLTEKAKGRAEKDLLLLRSGWGKAPQMLPFAGTVESVQSVISCLAVCAPSTLGRFVESRKALVRPLVEQFLVLVDTDKTSPVELQTGWVPQDRSFDAWINLYLRVADACSSAGDSLIGMTDEAGKLLLEYLREEMTVNPVPCRPELGPLIAAKLALCFNLCLAGPKSQVSAEVMRDAIGMARWLVRTSAQAKTVLLELNLRRHAQRLLARIPSQGPVEWRDLCRHFNPQTLAFHQPAVDWLVASEKIVRNSNGSLERVSL
jgi:hypothetical protein